MSRDIRRTREATGCGCPEVDCPLPRTLLRTIDLNLSACGFRLPAPDDPSDVTRTGTPVCATRRYTMSHDANVGNREEQFSAVVEDSAEEKVASRCIFPGATHTGSYFYRTFKPRDQSCDVGDNYTRSFEESLTTTVNYSGEDTDITTTVVDTTADCDDGDLSYDSTSTTTFTGRVPNPRGQASVFEATVDDGDWVGDGHEIINDRNSVIFNFGTANQIRSQYSGFIVREDFEEAIVKALNDEENPPRSTETLAVRFNINVTFEKRYFESKYQGVDYPHGLFATIREVYIEAPLTHLGTWFQVEYSINTFDEDDEQLTSTTDRVEWTGTPESEGEDRLVKIEIPENDADRTTLSLLRYRCYHNSPWRRF